MTPTNSSPSDIEYLTTQVEEALTDRSGVISFGVEPTEPSGVLVTIQRETFTEHYHVTLEKHVDGDPTVHWNFLGEEGTQ